MNCSGCEWVAYRLSVCQVLTIVSGRVSVTDQVRENARSTPRSCAQQRWRLSSQAVRLKSLLPSLTFPLIPFHPLPSSVLARPEMLLAWIYVPLLFTSVANALRNDRQLRHRLKTGSGNKTAVRRSLENVVLTVEVVQACHCVSSSTP